jgi:hypothetical protein
MTSAAARLMMAGRRRAPAADTRRRDRQARRSELPHAQAHVRVPGGHAGRDVEGIAGTPWTLVAHHDDAVHAPCALSTIARRLVVSRGSPTLSVPKRQRKNQRKSLPSDEVVSELFEGVGSPGWARTSDFLINRSSGAYLSGLSRSVSVAVSRRIWAPQRCTAPGRGATDDASVRLTRLGQSHRE